MAIQQSRDSFQEARIGGRFYNVRAWEARCDVCGNLSIKKGSDPGLAHEMAWKEGFRPINVGLTRPCIWKCIGCLKKNGAGHRS